MSSWLFRVITRSKLYQAVIADLQDAIKEETRMENMVRYRDAFENLKAYCDSIGMGTTGYYPQPEEADTYGGE